MNVKKNKNALDYWESFDSDPSYDKSGFSPSLESTDKEFNTAKSRTFSNYFLGDDSDNNDARNSSTYDELQDELKNNISTSSVVIDDDSDSQLVELLPRKVMSFKDYFNEAYDDSVDNINHLDEKIDSFEKLNHKQVLDSANSDYRSTVQPEATTSASKKHNSKKLTLEEMQNAIAKKITLILHNGGVYYFNGRTYQAIGSSNDLLSLIRSHISTTAFSSAGVKRFFDLLVYLKADERLIPSNYQTRLSKSKELVVMRNGILNLRTLTLLPHSPYYLTFHEYDVDYIENKKPKTFLNFLDQISGGDMEIVQRIVEVVGYLLSGINRRYFFVAGTAHCSGKSTLGLLLQAILGEQYVSSISTHQLDARFALGGTRQKILNLSMDVPKGHLSSIAVSILKSISGGDLINIEEKYQQPERIVSSLRFLFGTNYKISVPQADDEDAFWDRMIILPFRFSIPSCKIDPSIVDRMLEEKNRIVSYCLRAMSLVLDNNCRFSPCKVADEMKAEWRNSSIDSKSFEIYWNEEISVTGNSDDEIFALDLYNQYKNFCLERDLAISPYNNMKMWISTNVPSSECWHKRIHRSGENPKSGFAGIKINK